MKYLALDIDGDYLKYALLESGVYLVASGLVEIERGPTEKRAENLLKALTEIRVSLKLKGRIQAGLVLSDLRTLTKLVHLPPVNRTQRNRLLEYEADSMMPSGQEDNFLSSVSILKNDRGAVSVARLSDIELYLDIFKVADIEISKISPANLCCMKMPAVCDVVGPQAVIEVCGSSTYLTVFDDGHPIQVYQIRQGLHTITQKVRNSLALTEDGADELLSAWLSNNQEEEPEEETFLSPAEPEEVQNENKSSEYDEFWLEEEETGGIKEYSIGPIEPTDTKTSVLKKTALYDPHIINDQQRQIIEREFKTLFTAVFRTLVKVRMEEALDTSIMQVTLGGIAAASPSIFDIAKETSVEILHTRHMTVLNPLENLRAKSADPVTCHLCDKAIGLALLMTEKLVLPDLYPLSLKIERERKGRKLLTWATAAVLALLPLPGLVAKTPELIHNRMALAEARGLKTQYENNLSEEAKLEKDQRNLNIKLAPMLRKQKAFKVFSAVFPLCEHFGGDRVWIKSSRIEVLAGVIEDTRREPPPPEPEEGEKSAEDYLNDPVPALPLNEDMEERGRQEKELALKEKQNCVLCEFTLEALNYDEVETFVRLLREEGIAKEVELSRAEKSAERNDKDRGRDIFSEREDGTFMNNPENNKKKDNTVSVTLTFKI